MHTLFLMRHAQPASHTPGGDRERPLTDVGRRQAREVGMRLGLRNVGHALVSDALRTPQTWDCLQLDCPVEFMRALYYCGTDTMRQRIAEIGDEVDNLLVIAHAPTIPGLAAQLAAMSGAEDEVGCWYPPATLTEVEVDGTWADLMDEYFDKVRLVGVQRPM